MKPSLASVVLVLLVLWPVPTFSANPAAPAATSGRVSGKVQEVGFRALILKQAIRFNLAGTAKNNSDQTVSFVLQGDPTRIAVAIKVIEQGTKKSSDVKVKPTAAKIDPKLK